MNPFWSNRVWDMWVSADYPQFKIFPELFYPELNEKGAWVLIAALRYRDTGKWYGE